MRYVNNVTGATLRLKLYTVSFLVTAIIRLLRCIPIEIAGDEPLSRQDTTSER